MLQELSEGRMVHLKGKEAEYRIRTELSPVTNAISQTASGSSSDSNKKTDH